MSVREVREALAKQIKNQYPFSLAGKTIEKEYKIGNTLYLIFKDGTFVAYEASMGYDNYVELDVTDEAPSWYTLLQMGLITEEVAKRQARADEQSAIAGRKRYAKVQVQNILRQDKNLLLEVLEEEGIITTNK